jgi:hypothetical protein
VTISIGENAMTDQNRPETDEQVLQRDRREQRIMWIFSACIALLIAGMMGAHVLFSHPTPATSTDISAQSRPDSAQ